MRTHGKKSYALLPRWVREVFDLEDTPKRAPGGGFLSRVTGEWLPSPWRVVLHGPKWAWVEVERIDALLERFGLHRDARRGLVSAELACEPQRLGFDLRDGVGYVYRCVSRWSVS